ncbi:hypothetical protein ABZ815_31900 [Nonomuraea sp. NPDC047529]|uniref:hypothetical protein n=1 Tax=Nonomuraea sp. NPDC047529 TaxID=3155623 RepID=UPI0033DC3E0A
MVHTIKHLTSVRPRRGRTAVAAGLAAVLAAGLVHASPAAASGTPAPYLPAPTGSRPVGTTSLYLKDTSRPDPWVPSVKARELMVSLWYPARSPGRHRAPYMTAKASELLLSRTAGSPTSRPTS